MEENKFIYADKEEQIVRANWLSIIIYAIFGICDLLVVVTATMRGFRSVGFLVAITVITFAFMAAAIAANRSREHAAKARYIILVALLILGFLMTYAFQSYYVRFGVVAPVAVFILYYDSKFMLTSAFSVGIVQILTTITKFVFGSGGVELLDIASATVVCIFYLAVICIVEKNGKCFQQDMLGSIQKEKEHQEKMMQDVIYVAGEVRKGTQGAMEIMNELNESTSVVTGAVRDISDSTQSTAENIQNQTVMTQNIQDSIENTLERSETMVSIAEKSKQLNNDNMTIMEDIKRQSRTISETNANVAETMQALQERANAVKGIADTIFAISSQTNLLALNASIESARAGEAGRGFAVVADEIRQLAEETRTETENIATILDELSENAERAVGVVAQSVEATNQQDELINKAAESIEAMDTNVNELTSNIEEIDNMLSNLSEANNQIVDSITQLSATTEEVTASSAQAEGISNQNLENADNTKEILGKVLSVSQALDKYVGKTEEPSEV